MVLNRFEAQAIKSCINFLAVPERRSIGHLNQIRFGRTKIVNFINEPYLI